MHEPQELWPRRAVGRLLASHPEAQSLLAEAGHWHALAEQSETGVARAFAVLQASRLSYEELRHRLDPRRRRTIHLGVTLTLTAVIVAALMVLDNIEFAGVLTGRTTAAAAAAATTVWAGSAWLAALATRERRGGLLVAVTGGAALCGLLLALLHGDGRLPAGLDPRNRLGVGTLTTLLILVLIAVTAVLIARTEPASLLLARRRWHRSRSDYEAAVALQRADAEAAGVARQGWHGLVQGEADRSAAGQD